MEPENTKLIKQVAMDKLKKQSKNMSKNIKILKNVSWSILLYIYFVKLWYKCYFGGK